MVFRRGFPLTPPGAFRERPHAKTCRLPSIIEGKHLGRTEGELARETGQDSRPRVGASFPDDAMYAAGLVLLAGNVAIAVNAECLAADARSWVGIAEIGYHVVLPNECPGIIRGE